LRERDGVWSQALADGEPVLVSRNQEMASPETRLCDGDEVGLFPPVTGG
jgi:molybdopterin synthase sulfur carrier subunit